MSKMLEAQPDREKGTKILAKSIYRELRGQGYSARQIVSLSTELIGLVTADIPRDALEQAELR